MFFRVPVYGIATIHLLPIVLYFPGKRPDFGKTFSQSTNRLSLLIFLLN